MLESAHNGQRLDRGDGSDLEFVPPARIRADYVREHRLHEARVLRAIDVDAVEQSEEAEAGAILEAELAGDVREIAGIARAWADANAKAE